MGMLWKTSKRNLLGILSVIVLILLSFGVIPAPGVNEKEFLIKDFAPQGEVKGRAEIKAVFNREAAPESSIGKPLPFEDLPFKFTPAIRGTGKWVDARTFVYYPSAGMLEKATLYTATARSDLRDREGLPLSGKRSFLFNTAPPVFIGAKQTDFDTERETVSYELEFSLPVSPARLRGYADVKDTSGKPVEFQIAQGPPSKKVRMNVLTSGGPKNMKLSISAGMPAATGNLGLAKGVSVSLDIARNMEIRDSNAFSRIDNGEIYVETTAPVDFSKAGAFIELTPKSSYTIEPRDRGFAIVGASAPDRVLTVRKGFPALVQASRSRVVRTFLFPEKEPEIRFRHLKGSSRREHEIPIETVNIDTVQILYGALRKQHTDRHEEPVVRISHGSFFDATNKEYGLGGLNKRYAVP